MKNDAQTAPNKHHFMCLDGGDKPGARSDADRLAGVIPHFGESENCPWACFVKGGTTR